MGVRATPLSEDPDALARNLEVERKMVKERLIQVQERQNSIMTCLEELHLNLDQGNGYWCTNHSGMWGELKNYFTCGWDHSLWYARRPH